MGNKQSSEGRVETKGVAKYGDKFDADLDDSNKNAETKVVAKYGDNLDADLDDSNDDAETKVIAKYGDNLDADLDDSNDEDSNDGGPASNERDGYSTDDDLNDGGPASSDCGGLPLRDGGDAPQLPLDPGGFDDLTGSSNDTLEFSTELPWSTSSSAPAAAIDATAAPRRSSRLKQRAALRFVAAMAAAPLPTIVPESDDGSVSSAGLCGSYPSPAKRQPRTAPVVWIASAPSVSPKPEPTPSTSWLFGKIDCFGGELAGLTSCFDKGELGTYVPIVVMDGGFCADPTEEPQ